MDEDEDEEEEEATLQAVQTCVVLPAGVTTVDDVEVVLLDELEELVDHNCQTVDDGMVDASGVLLELLLDEDEVVHTAQLVWVVASGVLLELLDELLDGVVHTAQLLCVVGDGVFDEDVVVVVL